MLTIGMNYKVIKGKEQALRLVSLDAERRYLERRLREVRPG